MDVATGFSSVAATGVAHGAGPHDIWPSELIVTDPTPIPVKPPDVLIRSDQAFAPAGGSGGSGTCSAGAGSCAAAVVTVSATAAMRRALIRLQTTTERF